MKNKIISILSNAAKFNENIEMEKINRIKNIKKDVVTKADMEIGNFIINSFLKDNLKILIESEEYGKQRNFENSTEDYYIVIDDIDGSNNLRVGKGLLPYCSMIVIFQSSNNKKYKFSDYKYAACIEYTSKKIFYTEKGLGTVEIYDINGRKIMDSIHNVQDNYKLALTLSTDILSSTRGGKVGYSELNDIYISEKPSELDAVYKKYATVDSGCSVFEYAMVGMKIRNGYVSKGKKMHELPLLYAFSKENGQEMCDFSGNSYDSIEYEFSATDKEVVSGNKEIVKDICKLIDSQRKFDNT